MQSYRLASWQIAAEEINSAERTSQHESLVAFAFTCDAAGVHALKTPLPELGGHRASRERARAGTARRVAYTPPRERST
jgi:hypothetical protein